MQQGPVLGRISTGGFTTFPPGIFRGRYWTCPLGLIFLEEGFGPFITRTYGVIPCHSGRSLGGSRSPRPGDGWSQWYPTPQPHSQDQNEAPGLEHSVSNRNTEAHPEKGLPFEPGLDTSGLLKWIVLISGHASGRPESRHIKQGTTSNSGREARWNHQSRRGPTIVMIVCTKCLI